MNSDTDRDFQEASCINFFGYSGRADHGGSEHGGERDSSRLWDNSQCMSSVGDRRWVDPRVGLFGIEQI